MEKKRSTALVRSVLLVLLVLAIFVAYRHLRYMQRVEEAREARVRAENERVTEPVELDPSDPTLQAVPNSRLAQVDDWVSENPDDLQGAIARYEELAGDHPGTTAGETAKLRIEELLEQKEQAVVDTLDSLASLAAPLIELGSFEEAAKLYESYVGTHAAETAEERRRRAQEIRNSVFEAPEPAPAEPVKSFARLLDETVGLMVSHKMSDASEMLVDALDNRAYEAEYGRLEQYLEILRTASGSDENVKNSFRRDRGRQIAVQFRSGKKQLEIVDVRGDKIVAKMVRNGAVIGGSFDFSVKQLGYLEILRRLGDDSDPGIALAKGLLALRAGSNAYARRYFAKLDPMLAERLIASVP